MAEGMLGKGKSAGDRRKSGVARRVPHTAHGGDMVGDKRKLRGGGDAIGPMGTSEGMRTMPIAAIAGETAEKAENGGGRRAMPKSMKVGDWK